MVEAQEGLVDRQVLASEWRKEKSGEEPWGPRSWPLAHRQWVWAPRGRSLGQASSQLQPSTQSKKGAERLAQLTISRFDMEGFQAFLSRLRFFCCVPSHGWKR